MCGKSQLLPSLSRVAFLDTLRIGFCRWRRIRPDRGWYACRPDAPDDIEGLLTDGGFMHIFTHSQIGLRYLSGTTKRPRDGIFSCRQKRVSYGGRFFTVFWLIEGDSKPIPASRCCPYASIFAIRGSFRGKGAEPL